MLAVNRGRGIYQDDVDCYICLTESARERFIRGGLPESKLTVRPNVLAKPPAPGRGAGGYALFVGRLTPEKGPQTLVAAWEGIDYPLRIVGDGALRDQLQQQCQRAGTRATFEGVRSPDQVAALMQEATFLVIPSECFEGFSITHLEALACGTPMIVSAIGALDELIDAPANGLKFTAGDATDLRRAALELLRNEPARTSMRTNNLALFERRYTPQRALEQIESIYRSVIASTALQATGGAPQSLQ
jgi:glycosyltransferase involved in cell wall biosynthesis